jgi:hypothetical protein
MSQFGKKGVRCDDCGKISKAPLGEYTRQDKSAGYISSHGRNCPHDLCEECEEKLGPDYACPICGVKPE